jgi:hypothetical protein
MSETNADHATPSGSEDSDGKIPFMQQLLDSPMVLLVIGVMTPMILYVLWGVIEVLAIPVAS